MAYKHAPHVAWRVVKDEVVILDLQTSVYYSLNEVAARIWELLCSGLECQAIIADVSGLYHHDRAEVAKDLESLVGELSREKLIVTAA